MLSLFLLALFCLPSFKSLWQPGFFDSHDGNYHLVRLMHFFQELKNGQFPVRFGTNMAFGYGYPVFNFFYPLPYYLGSLIHLFGFDFSSSIKLMIATSFIFSGFFCFLWLRSHFNRLPSFVGAVLFSYTPYRFLVNYVSLSIGTILSFVFIPLILLAISRFILNNQRKYLPLLSVSLACLITSHNVSALISFPFVLTYTLVLLFQKKQFNFTNIRSLLLSLLLSLGLSSFFLIPMIHDLAYVNLGRHVAVDYIHHFPTIKQLIYSPWGHGYSVLGSADRESFQVGIVQWLMVVLTLAYFIVKKILRQTYSTSDKLAFMFLIIFVITVFLMLPSSTIIWDHLPLMPQIQFPWRLLFVTTLIVPFLAAKFLSLYKNKSLYFLSLFFILLAYRGNHNHFFTRNFHRYPDNHYLSNQKIYYGSADIAWETRPRWVNFIPSNLPDTLIAQNPLVKIKSLDLSPKEKIKVKINATTDTSLTFNFFHYPNWQAKLGSSEQNLHSLPMSPDSSGLATINIPSGQNLLSISYAPTPIQQSADTITLFSLIILIFIIVLQHCPGLCFSKLTRFFKTTSTNHPIKR